MEKDTIRGMDRDRVKAIFYKRLNNFEWVDDWQRLQTLSSELKDLKEARISAVVAGLTRSGKLKSVISFFEQYEKLRLERIAQWADRWRGTKDPFRQSANTGKRVLMEDLAGEKMMLPKYDPEDFEKAFALLPDTAEGATSKDASDKQLAEIDEKILALKAEIDRLYPKHSRYRGGIEGDIRTKLVNWWIRQQKQVDSTINPLGHDLEQSREDEKKAYWALGIGKHLDKNAPFKPLR